MKHVVSRQYLILGALLIVGAFAIFLALSPSNSSREDVIRSSISNDLQLSATDTVYISAESGEYLRLNIHNSAGGGFWAIVRHSATSTTLITSGQDFPHCPPLEAAGVPIDLEPECWSADGRTLVQR